MTINRALIPQPHLEFTPKAAQELNLIWSQDLGLKDQGLRIQIQGKGCQGFTYSLGPSMPVEDDFILSLPLSQGTLEVLVDPFTAFYLQEATIDYVTDFEKNEEGLVVINHRESEHFGKFWKDHPDKVPPTLP